MRITCVHQGFELYGSDRSFIDSVEAFRAAYPSAEIVVVLPRDGPIVALLRPLAVRIVFEPLWILRRRDLPRLVSTGLLRLPIALARAAAHMRASDLVYLNTSVIVDYMLAAPLFSRRMLIHVHEIPERRVLRILRSLLRFGQADLIFNSHATAASYAPMADRRTHVVYNGIVGPPHPRPMTYDGARPLRVLMLGRLSRIKGQEVLVAALQALPGAVQSRLAVRIVGSAFEDPAYAAKLANDIAARGLSALVTLVPFKGDPSDEFRWADIVVVPSRLPESLGRVAIEASAWGRPALVSAIGGLTEVVLDGATGWHVPPGDAAALAAALARIVTDPDHWSGYPAAARARYAAHFKKEIVAKALVGIAAAKLPGAVIQAPCGGALSSDKA